MVFRCGIEESIQMQAATIDDRGYITLRFFPVKVDFANVKGKDFKFNS